MKYLSLFLLALTSLSSFAQMTESMYNQLPDAIKPKNIHRLSYNETAGIIYYSSMSPFKTLEENRRVEVLCTQFTPLLSNLKTNKEKLRHLWTIVAYWHNRNVNLELHTKRNAVDSAQKYLEIYRKNTQYDSDSYENSLAFYYGMKGNLMNIRKNFPDAYAYVQRAMGIYKSKNDSSMVSHSYRVLSHMHNELGLYQQTVAYCDSSLLYLQLHNPNANKSYTSEFFTRTLIYKTYAFCALYSLTNAKQYADSVISNVNRFQAGMDTTKSKIVKFDILTRLNYYQRNYTKCITFADSSLSLHSNSRFNEDQINSLLYKALCLIRLGQRAEGIAIIKANKIQGNGPDAGRILEELYVSAKDQGKLKEALYYFAKFKQFEDSSKALKFRGEIFEIQKKYDVAARDLNILQLNEEKRKTRLAAVGIGLVICLAGIAVGIRFRRNQNRTRLLVNQIDDLTELQIQRIEEEKERERKRIAQELHDDLSSTIAAGVSYLKMKADEEHEANSRRHLLEISGMLERSYDKARGKSHELHREEATHNFWKRLSDNIELFFLGTDIKVSLTYDALDVILTPELKTTVLLIVKEAMTNIIKHARATEVDILIYEDTDSLILKIVDNGKGISDASTRKNLGLRSIQERATNFHGGMRIVPTIPSGVTLIVTLCLNTDKQSVSNPIIRQTSDL